jgi:cytoskeletal protein CcmA (bactofilin family)
MAISPNFFNKREPIATPVRLGSAANSPVTPGSMSPSVRAPAEPELESLLAMPAAPVAAESTGSKLTVGPNIKLKGVEITDCDTLVVEGFVEATIDSRVMHISECGAFKGSAEIDIAEIHGQFDGNLTVRQKLTIYASGKVTGKIRYGKLVIEEGGQLAGDIQFGAVQASKSSSNAERQGFSMAA